MNQAPTDLDCILAMQTQDDQALELLYERYFDKLYKYFYFRTYDEALAQDLNSTTWMHIIEKITTFDTEKSTNVSGRMYRIAHNKLVDHRRTQTHESSLQEDRDTVSYHPQLLEQTQAKMVGEKLLPIVDNIHPYAKDILLMKVWENMTHEEIATQLNISKANSKKIYSRTLQYLQENHSDLALSFILALAFVGPMLSN